MEPKMAEIREDLERAQCCGRQNTADVLRQRARMMVEQSVKLNKLADAVQHIDRESESILHEIVWNGLRSL